MTEQLAIIENEQYTELGMLNVVAEARCDMPIVSQKLFIEVLANVDITKSDFEIIKIPLNEFAQKNNISKTYISRNNLKIARETLHAQFEIKSLDSDKFIVHNIFGSCEYDNGLFTIEINEKLKSYFLDIYSKGNYFKFIKEYIASFTCKYSMKLYLLCQSNLYKCRNRQKVVFSLEYLREFYDLEEEEYKELRDFNKNILVKALNEINEKTNLHVETKNIKSGRNITGFEFIIAEKLLYISAEKADQYNPKIMKYLLKDIMCFENINKKQERIISEWFEKINPYIVFYFADKAALKESPLEWLRSTLGNLSMNFTQSIDIVNYVNNSKTELKYIADYSNGKDYDAIDGIDYVTSFLRDKYSQYIETNQDSEEILAEIYNNNKLI